MMSRPRLALSLIALLMIAGFVGLGTWAVRVVEDAIGESAATQLRALHSSDVASVSLWVKRKADAVGSVAAYAARPALALVISSDEDVVEESRVELARRADAAGGFFGFDEFILTDTEGTVLATSDSAWALGELAGSHIVAASQGVGARTEVVSRPFEGPLGEHRFAASAPVRDPDGAVVAVLHLLGRPDDELYDLLALSRPGVTGETLMYRRDGRLLSNSRFSSALLASGRVSDPMNAGGALEIVLSSEGGLLTRPVEAVSSDVPQGEPVEYISYMGEPVLGVWTWMPELDAGLVTEVSIEEAMLPAKRLRGLVALLIAVLAILVAAMAGLFLVARELGLRARRATQAAAELGQYQLLGRIGQGSMGTVYKARHRMLQRPTAVKVLRDAEHSRNIQRFEREVRMTAELTHPNTIEVYDYGRTEDGRFYYAMEYLPGLDLRTLIEVYGRQPSERVAHIIIQVASSLAEAHRRGLVHRDVKAANVILCERGGRYDVAKVLDFGLVIAASDSIRAEKGLIGTPIYLAPELCAPPMRPSPRSDLYALGCLAYELVTGKPPFSGPVASVLDAQQHRQPVPPSMRAEGVDPALESVIMACLAKSPVDRPSRAEEVAQRLIEAGCASSWTAARAATWWIERDPTLSGIASYDGDPDVIDLRIR